MGDYEFEFEPEDFDFDFQQEFDNFENYDPEEDFLADGEEEEFPEFDDEEMSYFFRRLFRKARRAVRRVVRHVRRRVRHVARRVRRHVHRHGRRFGRHFRRFGRTMRRGFHNMGRAIHSAVRRYGPKVAKWLRKWGPKIGIFLFRHAWKFIRCKKNIVGCGVGIKTLNFFAVKHNCLGLCKTCKPFIKFGAKIFGGKVVKWVNKGLYVCNIIRRYSRGGLGAIKKMIKKLIFRKVKSAARRHGKRFVRRGMQHMMASLNA